MYRSPPLGVCGVSSARNAWEAGLVPGPKRRFCLTSSAVTQSTPNRTPEEVIAPAAGDDRKRTTCRTLLAPPRVLPVIMTCGNMDFSALFPEVAITESTRCRDRVCDRSQHAREARRPQNSAQSEHAPGGVVGQVTRG